MIVATRYIRYGNWVFYKIIIEDQTKSDNTCFTWSTVVVRVIIIIIHSAVVDSRCIYYCLLILPSISLSTAIEDMVL